MIFLPDLRLDAIDVPENRARDFDPIWAEALKDIIRENGLLNPITVRQVGERYRLVAGLHRYYAHLFMGDCESITAVVSDAETDDQARLQEVMENLGRNELNALDRCHHLYELKQVWERMYPETKNGGDKNIQKGLVSTRMQSLHSGSDSPPVLGFAHATADKVGLGWRAISLAVKIWTGLSPQSRTRLRGSDLAKKQTELKALSDLPSPIKQARVLDLILGDEFPDILNVSAALAHLEDGSAETQTEKQFRAARMVFSKLPDAALDMVISAEADRVIASLKRLGRI